MVAKILSVDCENLIEIASRVFDWFGSFRTSLYARLVTDRQTDRHRRRHCLKPPTHYVGRGFKIKERN